MLRMSSRASWMPFIDSFRAKITSRADKKKYFLDENDTENTAELCCPIILVAFHIPKPRMKTISS